jgi:hypothetical protein
MYARVESKRIIKMGLLLLKRQNVKMPFVLSYHIKTVEKTFAFAFVYWKDVYRVDYAVADADADVAAGAGSVDST